MSKLTKRRFVAEVNLLLVIKVSVIITFAVHDSVDGDDVPMGGVEITKDIGLHDTQALVAFSGDFQTDSWDVSEVELSPISKATDLGFVEPDWRNREREES